MDPAATSDSGPPPAAADVLEQKKQTMREAAGRGDFVSAGELQKEVKQLEELKRSMDEAVNTGDFVEAGRLQLQFKAIVQGVAAPDASPGRGGTDQQPPTSKADVDASLDCYLGNESLFCATIMISDIYDHHKETMAESAKDRLHGQILSALEAAKYDAKIDDHYEHLVECLGKDERSIFVINSGGHKVPVSFNAPLELQRFCKSAMLGEITEPQFHISFRKPSSLAGKEPMPAVEPGDNEEDMDEGSGLLDPLAGSEENPRSIEDELNEYIGQLKYTPRHAIGMHNKWKAEGRLDAVSQAVHDRCMSVLTPAAKEDLEKKIDLPGQTRDFITDLLIPSAQGQVDPQNIAYMLIHGELQSGKTQDTAYLVMVACVVFKLPAVLVTNKSGFSSVLKNNLVRLMLEMSNDEAVAEFCRAHTFCMRDPDKTAVKAKDANDGFMAKALVEDGHLGLGALLVIGDTCSQVKESCRLLTEVGQLFGSSRVPFALIVDESDIVNSRKEQTQIAQAMKDIQALGPVSLAFVSATLLPNMVELMRIGAQNVKCRKINPGENYNSLESLRPPTKDGKDRFLKQDDLRGGHRFDIPYTNDKMLDVFTEGLSCQKTTGKLFVVITNPRVYIEGNINEQAEKIQAKYADLGHPLVVITVAAKSDKKGRPHPIEVKLPEGKWEGRAEPSIPDVLNYLNKECGLDMPIAIFGSSQLNRGVSIWSSDRVVTHIIVLRGRGFNLSEIIQIIGRACFQGLDILRRNGFDFVTILTTASDLQTSRQTTKFIREVFKMVEVDGVPFQTAIGCIDQDDYQDVARMRDDLVKDGEIAFPADTNVFRSTSRQLSPLKRQKKEFETQVSFQSATELGYSEQELYDEYIDNTQVQRFMRTLVRLHEDSSESFLASHVKEAYDEEWADEIPLTKGGGAKECVKSLLKTFASAGKLHKYENPEGKNNPFYSVKDPTEFAMLLSEDESIVNDYSD